PTYRPCARASATGWPACGSSPCRPRGSSPAEGSPAVIPDSESAPRTCLLSSTLIRGIMVHHCPTRRVYKKDTCLRIDLCTARNARSSTQTRLHTRPTGGNFGLSPVWRHVAQRARHGTHGVG